MRTNEPEHTNKQIGRKITLFPFEPFQPNYLFLRVLSLHANVLKMLKNETARYNTRKKRIKHVQ
ncbi:hypothetical protein GCM10020331_004580 [Ectobacillus funiculus]